MKQIGVVVIGRNEGERLKVCIRSLATLDVSIVYVDSGSSDGSAAFVNSLGFDVVDLDMSIPFSAARARNEGYRYLLDKYPQTQFIQFVDGDCEVCDGWIEKAKAHLIQRHDLAAVCGRRKERYPEKTIYNMLCDIEWNTPVGEAMATGGDFMCRKQAIVEVDGFSPQVIAGEEPEMCFRMRQKGWKIERLNLDMTLHDADMTRFFQWWKRNERSGHAYAQGFSMYGNSSERYYRNDVARIILWSLLIPAFTLVLVAMLGVWGLLLLLVYPVKVLQLTVSHLKMFPLAVAFAHSFFLILGKFPQCQGVLSFALKKVLGHQFHIIEYK